MKLCFSSLEASEWEGVTVEVFQEQNSPLPAKRKGCLLKGVYSNTCSGFENRLTVRNGLSTHTMFAFSKLCYCVFEGPGEIFSHLFFIGIKWVVSEKKKKQWPDRWWDRFRTKYVTVLVLVLARCHSRLSFCGISPGTAPLCIRNIPVKWPSKSGH